MDERVGEVLSVDVETIDEWADKVRDFLMILICQVEKTNRALQMDEQSIGVAIDA
jgi:hypothetical protein